MDHFTRNLHIYFCIPFLLTACGCFILSRIQSWYLEFDGQADKELGGRWQNQTMGWTSTGDPLTNQKLTFASKDAAVAFAEKQGEDHRYVSP